MSILERYNLNKPHKMQSIGTGFYKLQDRSIEARRWRLTPVILATQEADIRRMTVRS
jgi:hypothetical protein